MHPNSLAQRILAYLHSSRFVNMFLVPLARGVPGEGPDSNLPREIKGFGPLPAWIRRAYRHL